VCSFAGVFMGILPRRYSSALSGFAGSGDGVRAQTAFAPGMPQVKINPCNDRVRAGFYKSPSNSVSSLGRSFAGLYKQSDRQSSKQQNKNPGKPLRKPGVVHATPGTSFCAIHGVKHAARSANFD
jgi:hypothetical protein